MDFLSHQKNPQGFFWVEKPLYIMLTFKTKQKLVKKKQLRFKQIIAFFRGHQGEAQAFELAPFASVPDDDGPYIQGKWGPYLGGSSAPSKVLFF